MRRLGHHGIRRQGDDVIANSGQSFTLRIGDISHELVALPWQIYLHLLQFNRASNSPHAGFCFPFHTRSSPGEYSEKHSYLQRMCPSRVIIGISAVGGYRRKKIKKIEQLGTYNPQHSHTDMHKHKTNESPVRRHVSLYFSVPASLSVQFFSALNSLALSLFHSHLSFFPLRLLSSLNIHIIFHRDHFKNY